MNSLKGNIHNIEENGNLSLVTVKISPDILIKTIIVETPNSASYLREKHPINVLFKETEVVIGTDVDHDISLQNRIPGIICDIQKGALLSKIVIKTNVGLIESIISTRATNTLKLTLDQRVRAMIKLNEIMLAE